jgi:hypothetical protein
MGVHYDWNIDAIAQFYATLFLEEAEDVRAMHWMTEDEWYHITFDEFATRFSYGQADKDRFRIHIHNPLGENEIKLLTSIGPGRPLCCNFRRPGTCSRKLIANFHWFIP